MTETRTHKTGSGLKQFTWRYLKAEETSVSRRIERLALTRIKFSPQSHPSSWQLFIIYAISLSVSFILLSSLLLSSGVALPYLNLSVSLLIYIVPSSFFPLPFFSPLRLSSLFRQVFPAFPSLSDFSYPSVQPSLCWRWPLFLFLRRPVCQSALRSAQHEELCRFPFHAHVGGAVRDKCH